MAGKCREEGEIMSAFPATVVRSAWRRALDDAYDCCRAAGLDHLKALELSEAAIVACAAAADQVTPEQAITRTLACTQAMLHDRASALRSIAALHP